LRCEEFDRAIDTATVEIDGAKPSAEGRGSLYDSRLDPLLSQQTPCCQAAGTTTYNDDIEVLPFGSTSLSHDYTPLYVLLP
jgi:hypothetical protein